MELVIVTYDGVYGEDYTLPADRVPTFREMAASKRNIWRDLDSGVIVASEGMSVADMVNDGTNSGKIIKELACRAPAGDFENDQFSRLCHALNIGDYPAVVKSPGKASPILAITSNGDNASSKYVSSICLKRNIGPIYTGMLRAGASVDDVYQRAYDEGVVLTKNYIYYPADPFKEGWSA